MAGKSSLKGERLVAAAPRRRSMALGIVLLLVGLWAVGFTMFLTGLNSPLPPTSRTNDLGIVVFTGGTDRMSTAMDVLTSGAGQRLLISGVNETSSRDALRAHVSDPDGLFDCCVDLDYASRDTYENAAQSVEWATEQGYDSLLVVTSYYHMPRALLELRHRNANLALIPHKVYPPNYNANNWWYPATLRTLSFEYAKYEMAMMRIRLANLLDL